MNNYIIKKNTKINNEKINNINKNKINNKNNCLFNNLFQIECFLNNLSCFFKAHKVYKIFKK